MKNTFASLLNKILVATISLGVVLFTLSCLAPFVDASRYWYIAITGLAFPWLLIGMLILLFTFALRKSILSFAVVTLLLFSWPAISVTVARNLSQSDPAPKGDTAHVRILSWNVFRWDEMRKHTPDKPANRIYMLEAVAAENADVLVLHEFYEPVGNARKTFRENVSAIKAMGYPYHSFFPTSIIHSGTKLFGMAIFSRYPIVDSSNLKFGQAVHSEGLMYVDIHVGGKTVRIFSTHLESFKIGKSTYYGENTEGLMSSAKNSLGSVRHAYALRGRQTRVVHQAMQASPHPLILCGNLGDVPASNTYTVITEDYKDAFLYAGSGFGKTFRHFLPNLRLDYILTDKRIIVHQFRTADFGYSDHFALVADLALP